MKVSYTAKVDAECFRTARRQLSRVPSSAIRGGSVINNPNCELIAPAWRSQGAHTRSTRGRALGEILRHAQALLHCVCHRTR